MTVFNPSLKTAPDTKIQFAVIGGGVIGGGWVARFLLMGFDVKIFDPDPEAERKIIQVIENEIGRAHV